MLLSAMEDFQKIDLRIEPLHGKVYDQWLTYKAGYLLKQAGLEIAGLSLSEKVNHVYSQDDTIFVGIANPHKEVRP